MGPLKVRYSSGHNISGTGQNEVLEFITHPRSTPIPTVQCRCIHPQHHTPQPDPVEEGPYVILYTETNWAAEAIAAILNADGTDNGFPLTPMAQAYDHASGSPFRPWEKNYKPTRETIEDLKRGSSMDEGFNRGSRTDFMSDDNTYPR